MSSADALTARVDAAQSLRLQRMGWGLLYQCATLTVVLMLWAAGTVPGRRAAEWVVAVTIISLAFVLLVKSNLNLRFRDPSLTAAQIVAPMWPGIYVMYFMADPQARTTFLLIATGSLMFGMFALDRRGMLRTGLTIVLAYVLLLGALQTWAPERVNLRIEAAIVFAYAAVLVMVAYLGSFISGLRASLRTRNRELQEAMQKLANLAAHDPLTDLPNRRSIMERLNEEQDRIERRAAEIGSLCVCVLDVDHFKRINDQYGHPAGDAVLRRVGDALQRVTRQGDFVGRYGGEEFVLILRSANREQTQRAAERIRSAIEQLELPEIDSGQRITVSLGMAFHRVGEAVDVTLGRADQALYRAKAEGRNRVTFAEA